MHDAAQFLPLFQAHEPELRAYIGSLVRDPGTREDLMQEVALALWQGFDRFDRARSFGAWARGVATHKILHMRRHEGRSPVVLSPRAIEAIQEGFERTERSSGARQAALVACLRRLSEKSSQLLTLRYDYQQPAAEIAPRVGMSVEAVYQALSRLRAQLAECIRRRLDPTNTQPTTIMSNPRPPL
jgi:RNA polymerase sigma-70 factor (ECF subfamily)